VIPAKRETAVLPQTEHGVTPPLRRSGASSTQTKPVRGTVLSRLGHAIGHLKRGTVLQRIRDEWRVRVKRRREAQWQRRMRTFEYMDIEIQPGVRLRLYSDSRLSADIFAGDFELREREFLNAFLRPGDVFVDVGANVGVFALIAARRVGHMGRVYAFEPCQRAFERLTTNVRLNSFRNIRCHRTALSSRKEWRDIHVSLDGFDAWNSFAQPIAGNSFARERVQCITWDSFATEDPEAGRVTLMKIDVEGWEGHVLEGASETLSRDDAPLLLLEFSDATCQPPYSCKALYGTLQGFGYRIFTYDPDRRRLVPDPLRDSYGYVNLIASKRPVDAVCRLRARHLRSGHG